jgi:hypothetical protein
MQLPDEESTLRARFEAGDIAPGDFDHEAHVRVARACLRDFGLPEGARRFVAALRAFTARHGVAGKYHDTLTHALLHLIYTEMKAGGDEETFARFRERCPDLFGRARALVERHYTRELLDSAAARAAFVEPDRAPLPHAKGKQA